MRNFKSTRRSYISRDLRRSDKREYKAAGIVVWRETEFGGFDVLLGRQVSTGKGPNRYGTWSYFGGKRDPGEYDPLTTAARELHEESLGYLTSDWAQSTSTQPSSSVLWNPVGEYAVYLFELANDGGAVADEVSRLETGEALQLDRFTTLDEASMDATAFGFAVGRTILDENRGPMLLSHFFQILYEREPRSREEVKMAGSAGKWCERAGILTAQGPKGTKGMETAWLARSEQLEVSSMLWIPWALLASRRDYSEDIELNDETRLRIHPYLARILSSPAGGLLRKHFEVIASKRLRA